MKPVHQLLPMLENAVSRRIDAPEIDALSEGDLRTLVYQIVDAYQRRFVDPEVLLTAALASAEATTSHFREVKSRSIVARAKILDWLLPLLARAIPAIGMPVRESIRRKGSNAEFLNHPLVRGIELASARHVQGSKREKEISGRSWWALGLAAPASHPHACWAVLEHHGALVDGHGDEVMDIILLDALKLGEQINDTILGEILATFATRLRGASGGQLPRLIEHDERSHQQLLAMLNLIGQQVA